MKARTDLHTLLCTVLGSSNVYFQPTNSVSMKYPAIVYSRNRIDNDFADGNVYKQDISYQVVVIDKNPDSMIPIEISQLPKCRYDRHYVSDNLNHDVFTIYF